MGKGDPVTSPYMLYEAGDYLGRVVRITVDFNASTRVITGVTVFRDAGCLYHRILIGTAADGNPEDTDKIVTVPAGTTVLTAGQLNVLANHGGDTIENLLTFQITAAP